MACAACNKKAELLNNNFIYKKQTPVVCKYSLEVLNNLIVGKEGIDKAWIQSAINVNNTKYCNKYNLKIDEIIS